MQQTVMHNLVDWIGQTVASAGKKGVALGLSGGIDSAVVAALCARSLGAPHTHAYILPCESQGPDAVDAERMADFLRIEPITVDLTATYTALLHLLPGGIAPANANLKPRLRMLTLYHQAQSLDALVAGTGNRAEIAVGYFTKHGDGAVDFLPLAGFLKHQVREMAGHLGLPQWIVDRVPSAGLWQGQSDEGEMGISYKELDHALACIAEKREAEVAPTVLAKVRQLMRGSEHKRVFPPAFDPN